MPANRTLCALTAALVLAAALPARADEPATSGPSLTDRVDGAIAGATSYRVLVNAPDGLTVEIRSFGPDRIHVASTIGPVSSESIVVGTAMYYRTGGTGWKAAAVPPIRHVRKNRLYMGAPDTALVALDDRTEDGTVVGAFRSPAVTKSSVPGTMDCTYDKATYRPRTCMVSVEGLSTPVRVTYDRWDDPTNAVEPPPGVAPPTPAPATPAPGAPH